MPDSWRRPTEFMLIHLLFAWLFQSAHAAEVPAWNHMSPREAERFDYCESDRKNSDFLAKAGLAIIHGPERMREVDRVTQRLVRQGIALAESLPSPEACRRAFREGEKYQREVGFSVGPEVRRRVTFKRLEDPALSSAHLQLGAQWMQDEMARAALGMIPASAPEPSMRWARALAEARMGYAAQDSALVLSQVHHEFGGVDPVRFGQERARQAEELAQRYGISVTPP